VKKHLPVFLSILVTVIAGFALYLSVQKDVVPLSTPGKKSASIKDTQKPQDTTFDKAAFSIDDPESSWVVVNKLRPLNPQKYRPTDLVVPDVLLRVPGHETMKLRREAATALEKMFSAAQDDGFELMLSSAFRSYEYQQNLYGSYVRSQGQTAADKESARPGHSEHQTGLAADIRPTNGECELEQCFGEMKEGKWVADNAAAFGYIIRYTQSNTQEAGYSYEPWHVRYVGLELAAEYTRVNATSLESFFELEPAANYN
jgi:zinc D-Ala-D-Ala carboxypeptidase